MERKHSVLSSFMNRVDAEKFVADAGGALPSDATLWIVDGSLQQVVVYPEELQRKRLRIMRKALEEVDYEGEDYDIILSEVEQLEMWLERRS